MLLLGQNEEPLASQWQHDDGRREDVMLQASAWGSDLEGLIALARYGSGVVLAPDFCVEAVAGLPEPRIGGPALVNVLPGWRLQAGIETVQALTLPVPAGSETARALVRFVRQRLSGVATGVAIVV